MSATPWRPTRRGLRLASGLTLFVYVAGHFTNHALGLVSLAAAEQGLRVAVAVWQSRLGTLALYGAVAVHVGLAFVAIHQHRTLRLPLLEWVRIAAGLSIPTLLIGHAVDTRLALEAYGHPTDYAHVVWSLWHSGREGRQIALLVPGWLHGCLGLSFALSGRAWYPRWRMALFGAALLLPVLAVLGFFSMLKEVTVLAQDPAWVLVNLGPGNGVPHPPLILVRQLLLASYGAAIGAVFIARIVRSLVEERRGSLVAIGYPQRSVRVPRGWSVLEASRAHRLSHVSMCGGRARCSTCRVRVVEGLDQCPPPGDAERRTLARIHAGEGTRLACQLRPRGDVSVVPLVMGPAQQPQATSTRATVERELAVLRVQIRWGPRKLLPHDRLHALDRFGTLVGETTRAAGGLPIQFTGSSVTVLFGLDAPDAADATRALRTAAQLALRLREWRARMQDEFGCDLQHVIGLHHGAAVVGETGDRWTRTPMATGDAIDVVGQLVRAGQPPTPVDPGEAGHAVLVSRNVFAAAQRPMPAAPWQTLTLQDGRHIEFARLDAAHGPGVDAPA